MRTNFQSGEQAQQHQDRNGSQEGGKPPMSRRVVVLRPRHGNLSHSDPRRPRRTPTRRPLRFGWSIGTWLRLLANESGMAAVELQRLREKVKRMWSFQAEAFLGGW